jgi:Ca2+-dependent lipid-binding protein
LPQKKEVKMMNLKLGVEVVSAHDLMPKDSNGAANAFVELHFDHQRFRTTVKDRDLNPYWNEPFYFNVSDPASLPEMELEASVYHHNPANNSKSFLGKVLFPKRIMSSFLLMLF